MASQLTVAKVGGGVIDLTGFAPALAGLKGAPYFEGDDSLIELGMRFANGEAAQGSFKVVDPTAEIAKVDFTYNLPAHKIVTWIEDAPGFDCWLFRGRIPEYEGGRGHAVVDNFVEFDVTANDINRDLRYQAFTAEWVRPAETDVARLVALDAYTLSGASSTATDHGDDFEITISSTHLAPNTDTVTMPAKTYPVGTQPQDVIQDCADAAGKVFGVVPHHTGGSHACLRYHLESDHSVLPSAIRISDNLADWDPEDLSAPVFEPHWESGKATLFDGGQLLSGLVSIGSFGSVFVEFPSNVTDYGYAVEAYYDSTSTTVAQATVVANGILSKRRLTHLTHRVSIIMLPEQVDLVATGQSLEIKAAAAIGGQYLDTWQERRVAECKFEPRLDGRYWAHLNLDRQPRSGPSSPGKTQPAATTPKPPPQCDTGTGLTEIYDNAEAFWPGSYPYDFGDCGPNYHNVGASGGNAGGIAVSPSTSYNLNLIIDANRHAYTLSIQYKDGGGGTIGSDTWNWGIIGTDNGIECVMRTASFTTPPLTATITINFTGKLGGWRYQGTIDEVAAPPDNDPNCIDYGDNPPESPYFVPSDYFEDRMDTLEDAIAAAGRPPFDYVVAASDTSAEMQAVADAVCDGTADQTEINAAITAAVTANRPYSILLLPGTYSVTGSIDFTGLVSMGAKWVTFEASGTTIRAGANLTTMIKLDPGAGGQIITCADIRLGRLDGNKASFTVTQLVNIARFNDNILRIEDVDGASGIGVKVSQAGITDYPCGNNKIDIEIIHNCDGTAFIVTGTTANVFGFQGNTVHLGEIIACDNGIVLGSAVNQNASHNIFITGPIEHNDNYGIYDYCGGNTFIVANTNNNGLGSLGAPTGVTLRSSYFGGFEEAMDAAVSDQHFVQNFGAWQGITEFVQRASAPATPAAGRLRIYSKTDDKLYYKTDGGTEVEIGAGAGGAPTTADYLVGTAQGGLSAEIVVGATPGGELGGTWASPTVDATHSGSAHHLANSVRKNSAGSTFTRTRLNLIEGTNVTLTVADDAGDDEVDVTIDATATGSGVSTFDLDGAGGSTTSMTLVDTNLELAVAASTDYAFRAVIFFFTSVNTNGLRLGVNGPAGATGRWGAITPTAAAGNAVGMSNAQGTALNTIIFNTTTGPGVSGVMAIVEGSMVVAGTAGNLTIQYASETGGAVSIEPGSYLQLTQM